MTPTPEIEALGLLEIEGIPSALRAQDEALKRAPVDIIAFAPVSAGKVVMILGGAVACVEESLQAADAIVGSRRIDYLFLPGIHPSVVAAIHNTRTDVPERQSLGMMEFATAGSGILAADAAVKAAVVTLARVHLASGFGGKAFVSLWGEQSDVEAAVEVAVATAGENTLDHEVIPSPHSDLNPDHFRRPWSIDPAN